MTVITRFAPSPTGYLHLGGVRTALFNYLFAKHYDGKFILRIEDTDDKRLMESSLTSIVDGLDWLGIKHDGKIIIQSENRPRHHQIAEQLVSNGKAYHCYCTQEELAEERKKAGPGYKYSGKCKYRKDVPVGIKPSIRLNSESFDKIEFNDLIIGHSEFHRDNLDDFIILRSDGVPTYMFAVVVDDNDHCITHVIRGNDHHTNTAKQLMIYKLMGWKEPEYAHLPLINSDDGTKMSKRKHAVDILDYKHKGFLAPALVNYLMHLGWTPSKDIMSLEEAVREFGIGRMHNSPACFDVKKLSHINSHYLKEMVERNHKYVMAMINENYNYHYYHHLPKDLAHAIEKSLDEAVKRANTLEEIIDQAYFYCDDWKEKITEYAENKLFMSDFDKKVSNKELFVSDIIYEFKLIDDHSWNHDCIEVVIKNLCEKYKELKKADVMKFLRVVLTGTLNSYSIVKIIEILGKKRVLERLR